MTERVLSARQDIDGWICATIEKNDGQYFDAWYLPGAAPDEVEFVASLPLLLQRQAD